MDSAPPVRGPTSTFNPNDMVCHNCHQRGHKSKECLQVVVCNNCGGRGHLAVECPSTPMLARPRRR
nr:hypothetical protein PHYPA_006160 [Physcomitrium patens]